MNTYAIRRTAALIAAIAAFVLAAAPAQASPTPAPFDYPCACAQLADDLLV